MTKVLGYVAFIDGSYVLHVIYRIAVSARFIKEDNGTHENDRQFLHEAADRASRAALR